MNIEIKPYNEFLRTQTVSIKENVYLTRHALRRYAFYGKTNKLALWDKNISFNPNFFGSV